MRSSMQMRSLTTHDHGLTRSRVRLQWSLKCTTGGEMTFLTRFDGVDAQDSARGSDGRLCAYLLHNRQMS